MRENDRYGNDRSRFHCTAVNVLWEVTLCHRVSGSGHLWIVTSVFRVRNSCSNWLTLKMDAVHSFETSFTNRGSNPRRLETTATLLWKLQMLCVSTVSAGDWILTHSPFKYIKHSCHLHSRTVHLDVSRVFYLPTDAQESCFKNIKIYVKTALICLGLISVIRERIICAC
jgi:hypothetical protein